MPSLLPDVDPDGLLEYSVVYTDRAVNHMSQQFRQVMQDISAAMKEVYSAASAVIIPGSGTFGMESVARQFATGKNCLVIRNGWFSYRWSQILEMGNIPSGHQVMMAQPVEATKFAPFAPPPLDEVVRTIETEKPDVVFAPHVETSAGMLLPENYLAAISAAVRKHGGLFVLDCIAAGTLWIDMNKIGVDILVSAPQKGWSGSPCSGLVMLGERAVDAMAETASTSFVCDLKKWSEIMHAYESGGHAYHATMPTDALVRFRDVIREMKQIGWETLCERQLTLGGQIRQLLKDADFPSVAAPGFEAPGVIVCYTDDPEIKSGNKFAELGIQIAGGVPLQCNEPDWFQTFRIGLFGVDKLKNVDRTVATFAAALQKLT